MVGGVLEVEGGYVALVAGGTGVEVFPPGGAPGGAPEDALPAGHCAGGVPVGGCVPVGGVALDGAPVGGTASGAGPCVLTSPKF